MVAAKATKAKETITVMSTDKPRLYIFFIQAYSLTKKILGNLEGDFINLIYKIQAILQPFTGTNHYRFGSTLPEEIKLKISKTLKGRVVSEEVKANHHLIA